MKFVKRAFSFINSKYGLLFLFLFLIIASAAVYYLLDRFGLGNLISSYDESKLSSIYSFLYFSSVTITSLGYGDIKPIGISRFISSLEVILGLMIMGIFVSRVISDNQEKILKHLHDESYKRRVFELYEDLRLSVERLLEIRLEHKYGAGDINKIDLTFALKEDSTKINRLIKHMVILNRENRLNLISIHQRIRIEEQLFLYLKRLRLIITRIKSDLNFLHSHNFKNHTLRVAELINSYFKSEILLDIDNPDLLKEKERMVSQRRKVAEKVSWFKKILVTECKFCKNKINKKEDDKRVVYFCETCNLNFLIYEKDSKNYSLIEKK